MAERDEYERSFKEGEEIIRVRIPRKDEVLGIVEQALGSKRFKVRCADKKVRLCRIPGRIKRDVWIKEGNMVLVKPWEIQGDERGDILYKYGKTQQMWLERKGYLKEFE